MIVTSIEKLDKKRSRVLLDQDLALVLYPGDLRKFSLMEGSELSKEAYERLLNQVIKPRARERLLKTLMVSDKTEKQLDDLLRREGYPADAIEDALEMVKKYHYIDDEAYAERYIASQGKRKSRRQLMADMQKKGFDRDVIDKLLRENPVDEQAQIERYLAQKGITAGGELSRGGYGKLTGRLARKGYSYESISKVLKREPFF